MPSNFHIGRSVLSSSLRLWSGTWGILPTQKPQQLLNLFDREDDPRCRLVREALTELNLDAVIYPCPKGGQRFMHKRLQLQGKTGGTSSLPLLHDPNTGKVLHGPEKIIQYLCTQYLRSAALPARLKDSIFNRISSSLASLASETIHAQAAIAPKKNLVLYSFESSPFARLVRERLCALELPYHLINVGKMHWGEMGPAVRRLAPGPYIPKPGSKRSEFFLKYGKVQIPCLVDPNQNTHLFESSEIVQYLTRHYAK